ncbi:ABC-2 transporter permease [Oceanirhabdus sp. W0125-5]|uniref:ABC-2 transporter permease n=1 Tax=Oceanirhabdus sp. W0125-5 TaxID=2999116 RepID=UPI0022F32873|nr:ABC-2 transporter permease [Oceanirhabdus sp. W0125-5]WBW95736.1 ABC-2 transporter permease [Oceanirhabdus sp. W0125-5]
MGSLVMKDLSMLKYKWIFTMIAVLVTVSYGIASVYQGSADANTTMVFQIGFNMAGIFTVFLFCVLMPLGFEEQNKSDMILRSFPVNNGDVVIAKYIYTILIFILWVLVSKIGPIIYFGIKGELTTQSFQLGYIAIAAVGYLFLASIYLPFYFKYGYLKMRFINVILYLMVVLMPNILKKYFSSFDIRKFIKIVDKLVSIFGNVEIFIGCVVGVLFIISCMISMWVGNYREI